MLTYNDLCHAFQQVGLKKHSRVIAHISLPSLGPIHGGAGIVLEALLATCETIVMPAFTPQTMVIPQVGPPENGIHYITTNHLDRTLEIYHPDIPADPALGAVTEVLRSHPHAERSNHPLLSFVGINAEEALAIQSLSDPWAPIRWLSDYDADVLLLGVDHQANVSLHFAEQIAGRKQFVRWALTSDGIVTCPGYPGCNAGFQAIAPRLHGIARQCTLGTGTLTWIPLRDLIHATVAWIHQDPRALLCDRQDCLFCKDVRASVRAKT